MITSALMKSKDWKEQISNRLLIKLDVNNPDIDEDEKIDAAIEFYTREPKRNMNYLGNLIVARNTIILYGGGDSANMKVTPMAHIRLCEDELAEVNFQLDAITIFELDLINELYGQNIRAEWIDAADYIEYIGACVSGIDEEPATEEDVAEIFLSTLLGPYLMTHMTEDRILH